MLKKLKPWAGAWVCAMYLGHAFAAEPKPADIDAATVKAEHGGIGVERAEATGHTAHPDAQWFPDAGMGLFLHWGISSVEAMNISWPMIAGSALGTKRIDDPAERERIIRDADWNLDGKPPVITPNAYWEMAKRFNPRQADPDHWLKAAKDAGFTYAVLTTRHHEGFALWPSKYGDFNTATFGDGQDLVKLYVDACRANGLKVGLYYSPPDWHFDRDYMTFLNYAAARKNPWLPRVDADLKPATTRTPEETGAHQAAYAAYINGQVEELLTRYGKIDLFWFDGRPKIGKSSFITQDRMRELQPGIVINPRLHGTGDFVTFERTLPVTKPVQGWAEFCNTWTGAWPYMKIPYRANGFVLSQLATAQSLGVNYLLDVGPDKDGHLAPEAYANMLVVAKWMTKNAPAVHHVRPLSGAETANVPATRAGSTRYLFALPQFKNKGMFQNDLLPPVDATLTLSGVPKPVSVKLLTDDSTPDFTYVDGTITVRLPAAVRTDLPDVVRIDLPEAR